MQNQDKASTTMVPRRYSYGEIRVLLEVLSDSGVFERVLPMYKADTLPFFVQIASQMTLKGFPRTTDEIAIKFKSLLDTYKKNKIKVDAGIVSKSDWEFYEHIEELMNMAEEFQEINKNLPKERADTNEAIKNCDSNGSFNKPETSLVKSPVIDQQERRSNGNSSGVQLINSIGGVLESPESRPDAKRPRLVSPVVSPLVLVAPPVQKSVQVQADRPQPPRLVYVTSAKKRYLVTNEIVTTFKVNGQLINTVPRLVNNVDQALPRQIQVQPVKAPIPAGVLQFMPKQLPAVKPLMVDKITNTDEPKKDDEELFRQPEVCSLLQNLLDVSKQRLLAERNRFQYEARVGCEILRTLEKMGSKKDEEEEKKEEEIDVELA